MNNEPNKKNGAKPAVAHKKNILDDRRIRLALSVLGAIVAWMVVTIVVQPGTTRKTLGLDGTETFDVVGARTPRATLTLVVHRANGETIEVPVTCRLDSDEDVEVYEAGGVLQRFAQDFLAANKAA